MAVAVAEVRAVARVGDDLPGRAVDGLAGDAGLGGGDAGELGLEDRLVDQLHLVGGVTQGHGAGHVGAVVLVDHAEVHGDEVAGLELPLAGDAVGHGGVGAADNDGGEGQALGAQLVEAVDQLRGQLLLGHADLDPLADLGEGTVGDGLGLAHTLQLVLLLDDPEGVQVRLAGHQPGVELFLVIAELRHSQAVFLKAQGEDLEVRDGLVELLDVAVFLGHHADLKALEVLFGGLDVAGVGEVAAAVFGDDGDALVHVELGAVLTGNGAGEEQADILALVQQGQILFQIGHGFVILLFLAR